MNKRAAPSFRKSLIQIFIEDVDHRIDAAVLVEPAAVGTPCRLVEDIVLTHDELRHFDIHEELFKRPLDLGDGVQIVHGGIGERQSAEEARVGIVTPLGEGMQVIFPVAVGAFARLLVADAQPHRAESILQIARIVLHDGIELILADESLSPNSLKRLGRAAEAAGTECVTMPVAEVFPISSVKALGIRNGELAKAIINTIESK